MKRAPILDEINAVRDTHTIVTEGKDENGPVFRVWLKVDDQTFAVGLVPWDTLEDAEWYREQLAVALTRIVKEQQQ